MKYRAIEGTNTKTRRLAYLTAIVSIAGRNGLSEEQLLKKICRWSEDRMNRLQDYWVRTGAITYTKRNYARTRYLQLATNLGLITPISGAYSATRTGLVLVALLEKYERNINPFYLNNAEKIFYQYIILDKDADILLAVIDHILKNPGISLAQFQGEFQEVFLDRINEKIKLCMEEGVKRILLERRREVEQWSKPERYSEHIIPPRLNWLLDLEFLKPGPFRKHQYFFSALGERLVSSILSYGENNLMDVNDSWLKSHLWSSIAKVILDEGLIIFWEKIGEEKRREICGPIIKKAFRNFRHTAAPKISSTQALLYLSICLLLDHNIVANPMDLSKWFSKSQNLNGRQFEIRFSPRENESYLIMMVN